MRARAAPSGYKPGMKVLALVVGAALGLLFVAVGLMVLLDLAPPPEPPPEGSPVAHFLAAFGPTGYMTFVKVCEVVGGLLVAIPRTRAIGLVVLGPIVVNIVVFHLLVAGDGVGDPMLIGIIAATAFLVLVEGRAFFAFLRRPAA